MTTKSDHPPGAEDWPSSAEFASVDISVDGFETGLLSPDDHVASYLAESERADQTDQASAVTGESAIDGLGAAAAYPSPRQQRSGTWSTPVARPPVLLSVGRTAWQQRVLIGRGIDVIATFSIGRALAWARREQVAALVTEFELPEGQATDLIEIADTHGGGFPTVVILAPDEWEHAGACLRAGAADIVEAGDATQLLQVMADLVGLERGVGLRAPFSVPVRVRMGASVWTVQARDLRANGIAVWQLPRRPIGTRARVEIRPGPLTIDAAATLARTWADDLGVCTALRLHGLSHAQRVVLQQLVEARADPQP